MIKFILFFIMVFSSLSVHAQDYHIQGELNGIPFDDVSIVKADNNCTFFLADSKGRVEKLPDGYICYWYLYFVDENGNLWTKKMEQTSSYLQIHIEPQLFGYSFGKFERYEDELTHELFSKGDIVCKLVDLNTEKLIDEYKFPLLFDLLPSIPQMRVLSFRNVGDDNYDIILEINATNFIQCYLKSGYEPDMANVIYHIFDKTTNMPHIVEVGSALGYYFMVEAYNDYGRISNEKIWVDSLVTAISDNFSDKIGITCTSGECHITSNVPLANVYICDIKGIIIGQYTNVKRKLVINSLDKGMYIVTVVDKTGQVNKSKILIF